MSSKQLELCKNLYQAVLACKQQCEQLVPRSFSSCLLEALQHLMLQAVQVQQDEQLQAVRACIEATLQLLSRVSSLGPIEAFFVADELLTHYQWRLDATHALLGRLCCDCTVVQSAKATGAKAGGKQVQQQSPAGISKCQLSLPEQQQQVVQSFRRQAAKLCPQLTQSCPPAALQQLCDTVKQGLVLVNGHSFLIGQEWQAEVAAMLGRAEQLKVLLAHWQAHHLSLLASVLQLLHRQEVQQYDQPHSSRSSSPLKQPHPSTTGTAAAATLAAQKQDAKQDRLGQDGQPQQEQQDGFAGLTAAAPQQQLLAAYPGFGGVEDEALHDDEFFMPVAPLGSMVRTASGSPGSSPTGLAAAAAAAVGPPSLPFHIAAAGPDTAPYSSGALSDGDSLARTPSSGCSSLLEYVQNSMGPPQASQHGPSAARSLGGSPTSSNLLQQQAVTNIEQQLLAIAGSVEVAAVLADALGFEQQQQLCSRSSSYCGTVSSAGSVLFSPTNTAAAAAAAAASGAASFTALAVRESSACSGRSSPGRSRPASVLARLSSSASRVLVEGLVGERGSTGGGSLPRQQQQRQGQQRRRLRQPQKLSNKLALQHMQLPPGCCKSIGAVLYLCTHVKRLVLVDVGLTDETVGDLVDALKVNGSVEHLDLSWNALEDIGARVLALLVLPSAGSSSRLRTLCLQHNQIGDDGAASLANGLANGSRLQRLWLQHNAVGEAGAQALCRAMQHNTACTDLRLQPGNNSVPVQLAQTVQQLARQNRGARDHIKALLKMVHWPKDVAQV